MGNYTIWFSGHLSPSSSEFSLSLLEEYSEAINNSVIISVQYFPTRMGKWCIYFTYPLTHSSKEWWFQQSKPLVRNKTFFSLFYACKSVLILTHHWTISTAQRQLRKLTGGYRVRARERKNTPDEVSPPLIIEFRNLHVRFVLVSYGNTCPLKTPISFWAGKKVVLKLVRRLFKTAETRAIFLIMAMNFQKLPSSANAFGKATWGSNNLIFQTLLDSNDITFLLYCVAATLYTLSR